MRLQAVIPVLAIAVVTSSACSNLRSARSPDILYSDSADEARSLQIPPDLTDVSDAEQFILPGNSDAAISRNTLLPEVDGARFMRSDAGSWLELDAGPEALWPLLVEFLQSNGYAVAETLPVAGTLATRWSEASGSGGLRGLLGSDARERVAFRLERDGNASRLFARRQVVDADAIDNAPDWPASASDPEATSELLARLLVFLGLDEQQSRGVITSAQAADVLQAAVVRTSGAGSQMVVHRGYLTAFEDLSEALERSGNRIDSRDDDIGRIAFTPGAGEEAAEDSDDASVRRVLSIVPVHISAVRVAVTDVDGRRLPNVDERALLDELVDSLV